MCVYLLTQFQVSNPPPPPTLKRTPKNSTQVRVKIVLKFSRKKSSNLTYPDVSCEVSWYFLSTSKFLLEIGHYLSLCGKVEIFKILSCFVLT